MKVIPYLFLGGAVAFAAGSFMGMGSQSVASNNGNPYLSAPFIDRTQEQGQEYRPVAAEQPKLEGAIDPGNLPPCPTPNDGKKSTGILIEGNVQGKDMTRDQRIEETVKKYNIPGKWCISQKTGNKTWNTDTGNDVNKAVAMFNLFKEKDLISYAKYSNSPNAGRVNWKVAEQGGARQQPGLNSPFMNPQQGGEGGRSPVSFGGGRQHRRGGGMGGSMGSPMNSPMGGGMPGSPSAMGGAQYQNPCRCQGAGCGGGGQAGMEPTSFTTEGGGFYNAEQLTFDPSTGTVTATPVQLSSTPPGGGR